MSTFNGKYTSVEEIILGVYRDMGVEDNINIADAVEWAGEALELINPPFHLENKIKPILVNCYKAKIPCELHSINTIWGNPDKQASTKDNCHLKKSHFLPMRYTTDYFHNYCKHSKDHYCVSDLTYNVNDNYIQTSFEDGFILISYKAIPTDEKGYPKIPDDIRFKNAIKFHIMWKLAFMKFINGKMSGNAYQIIERDRDWYIASAQNKANMPGVDMMESIKNNFIRLIPKINQHSDGFKSAGIQEQRYLHNATTYNLDTSNPEDTFFYTK
jgi:hypothetical protein